MNPEWAKSLKSACEQYLKCFETDAKPIHSDGLEAYKQKMASHMQVDYAAAELERQMAYINIMKHTIPKDDEFLTVVCPVGTTPYSLTVIAQSVRRTLKMSEEKMFVCVGTEFQVRHEIDKENDLILKWLMLKSKLGL